MESADPMQLQFERGDDHRCDAAARGPEQIRIALLVGVDDPPVRIHRLDRDDAVGGEAVRAREPAEPSAEGEARDPHRRRHSGDGAQAVRGGGSR